MKKKRNKLDPIGNLVRYGSFSAKWTALFALIAIFSVMVLGITQVSFAAEDWPTNLSDVRMDSEDQLAGNAARDGIPNGGIKPKYAMANGKKVPVYCLEIWKHFEGTGESYTKSNDQKYMTPGVVALLTYANSVDGPFKQNLADNVDGTKKEQAIVQMALWVYLYEQNVGGDYQSETNSNNDGSIGDPGFYMSEDSIKLIKSSEYGQNVTALVDFAVNHAEEFENPTAQFSSPNGDWVADGNYMVSPEYSFTISPAGNLSTFTFSLSEEAPSGTKVIFNGQEYDASSLSSAQFGPSDLGKSFKVKVPKNEITNSSKTFSLSVNSTHSYYVGWSYSRTDGLAEDAQKIAAGNVQPKVATSSLPLTASYKVDVPKTAQNSSVILYIVGLIVLLSGVGVIYANVKPAKQK